MTSSYATHHVTRPRRITKRLRDVARRFALCSLALGLFAGIVGSSWSPASAAAATSKNKVLFVAVSNSYSAAVTEFNIVIESFTPCTASPCVSAAIEGAGDSRFYQETVALEKKAPYPSGISKDLIEYIGNLVEIQKDINAVAKATSLAKQKSIVAGTLEVDVDNLAFRGMHILIYFGEQKSF